MQSKGKTNQHVKQDLIVENQQLKERVDQLEMEIKYLKKLDVLFGKDFKSKEKVITVSELWHKKKLDKLLTPASIHRSTFYYLQTMPAN